VLGALSRLILSSAKMMHDICDPQNWPFACAVLQALGALFTA